MAKERKPANKLSLRKRLLALTANESVRAVDILKSATKLLNKLKNARLSMDTMRRGISILHMACQAYNIIMIEPDVVIEKIPNKIEQ